MPKCSVVIATHNKPIELARVLQSIERQKADCEVIVVDDGSVGAATRDACKGVTYYRIERESVYRNPCVARNYGYRRASGDIIICQSDEVIHEGNAIEKLCELPEGEFHLATVYNQSFDTNGEPYGTRELYVGADNQRPLFFLGSTWRKDLYAVGGNCESFQNYAGYDDDFFAMCLIENGLEPIYRTDVIGIHQDHPRPALRQLYKRSKAIFVQRIRECRESGQWTAKGGSWPT
jgi:glycosyltransferase involved in cell wall biosynthesis